MAMVAMVAIQHPALGRGSYDVDEDFKKYVAAIYWVQGPSKYSLGQTSGGIRPTTVTFCEDFFWDIQQTICGTYTQTYIYITIVDMPRNSPIWS